MPDKNDALSRDERDAVSAQMLLKKLRLGLDSEKREPDTSNDASVRSAAQISDEALELAKSEVIHAKPDEFGVDNLEDRLRVLMNVPKDEEPQETYKETVRHEDEGATVFVEGSDEDDVPWKDEEDAASFEAADENEATVDESDFAAEDEIDEEIPDAELINEVLAQTAVFGDIESEETEEAEATDGEDDGFLTKIALMSEEELKEFTDDGEFDDFMFVTDELPETADEKTEHMFEDDGALVSDDGGREYNGLNGVEMNSTEMSLISLFGGKDELEEAYGKEKAEEIIKERSEAPIPEAPKKKKFYELFSPDYEYVSPEQNDEIKAVYSKAFTGATVRFLFCIFFAAGLFLLENAEMLGISLPQFLNRDYYPIVVSMINLQLVLFCAYTVLDKLAVGFVNLFKLKPTFESVPALLVSASVIYTFAIAFISNKPGSALYNFPVALALLLTSLCEILNLKREAMSFDVVSSSRRKFTARTLNSSEKEEDALLFTSYVPGDSEMFAVTKTSFVEGFFSRINKPVYNRNISVLMIIALAGMLITAGFAIYLAKDTYSVITMAYLAFVLGLPGTVLFAGYFPFYRISKNAYESESAIVGESSVSEYSEGSVVFFDDKDIFPSTGVKINSVKVYGENRIDEVIYRAASVFAAIGGPLADVFSLATIEIGHSENVEILDSRDHGIHCTIDGANIYLGNNDYLVSNDFETPYGENDESLEKNNGVRLMFIADDNEILAKFYVQYTVDCEYEFVFSQLYKAGMCVGIRTWDPNISEEFIIKKLRLKDDYPVKVIHGKPGKEFSRRCERTDSGVVSAGSVKAMLKVLSNCDKIKYISKIHGIFEIVSAVVAILAVYGVAILGKLEIGSMFAALYELFWLIPIMLVAMFAD